MKAHNGSRSIPPLILNLGLSFTYRPLYPRGNGTWCPLNRVRGGLQIRCGRFGEGKNFLHPPIFEPRFRVGSARRILTIASTLACILRTVTIFSACQCAARIVRHRALRRCSRFIFSASGTAKPSPKLCAPVRHVICTFISAPADTLCRLYQSEAFL